MTAFINIAKGGTDPLFIDPSSLAAMDVDPEHGRLQLFTEDGVFWNGKMGGKLEPAHVVRTMQNHGHTLASFPARWRENKESTFYVAPHAVTYATISEANEEGYCKAIFGVKGVFRKETDRVTFDELAPVLDAVQKTKPMLRYLPEQARAYWSGSGALYIDPRSVTRIQEYATELRVHFNKSASLNVETPMEMSLSVIDGLSFEARARMQAQEKKTRQDFARELAKANGTLLSVDFAESAFHARREDIGYVEFADRKDDDAFILWLLMKTSPGTQNPEDVVLRYKTQEDRLRSFYKVF